MSKVININLPFFPGFYETIYENGDTGYWELKEAVLESFDMYGRQLTEDDFDFDYKARREDIAKRFVDVFKCYTPDCVEEVAGTALRSPTYYNYSNDSLSADVTLNDSWIDDFKTFIDKNREKLTKRIEDDWTSRMGYWSFVENRIDKFVEKLFNENDNEQSLYIGIMLAYLMEDMYLSTRHFCNSLNNQIAQDVLEEIYDSSYIINKTEQYAR